MKAKKWPYLLIGFVLLIAVIGSIWVLRQTDTTMVEIIQDGQVLYRIDLAHAQDQQIEVEYQGRVNTIEIQNHQIHMLHAQCPDQTCVHTGWLGSVTPIVCLPNRLVIQFANSSDALDAAG